MEVAPQRTPNPTLKACPPYGAKKWPPKGRWYAPTCVTPGVTARGHSISIRFPNPHDSWRTFKYLLVSHYFCQWKLSLGNKAFQLIVACVLLKNLKIKSVIFKIKQHSHIILVYGWYQWYMGTWALLAAVSNLIGRYNGWYHPTNIHFFRIRVWVT